MVTQVGTQTDPLMALQSLVELDYDAVDAYQAAIERLSHEPYKNALQGFCRDHETHIDALSAIIRQKGLVPPESPSMKHWLTTTKVVVANLMGDQAILRAMLSNEIDTNTAYAQMDKRTDLDDDIKAVIQRGLADENRHKAWLEKTLAAT